MNSDKKFRIADLPRGMGHFRFIYFSQMVKRPVCVGKIKDRIGKMSDLVFAVTDPYPEAVGIYIEEGWGKPTQFVPWSKVVRIEEDAIFVKPPENGDKYPPFVDQPGWIMVDKHLMGRTIVDMDDRRVEVVNDVHMLEARNRLLLVHVDISLSGFFRRVGLGKLRWIKDNFISWKYVQPLSVEDAVSTDKLSLSVTRTELHELPSEDLADMLEELPGEEQQALFSALDSEKAAETLAEAEPRAQRQIIASLREERARMVLSEMTVPQLAGLFTVLSHDQSQELMRLLPSDQQGRVQAILSEREATARGMMSAEFLTVPKDVSVRQTLEKIRSSGLEPTDISYVFVVNGDRRTLIGVVDLRELILAPETQPIEEVMTSPVVTAEEDDVQEDLTEMFAKYHFRMIPVVDHQDRILGVIRYNDIMKGVITRAKI
jgi:CBS domain-containing protein